MTDQFLKAISFIFHPILMPFLGVILYFSKTPRFIPKSIIEAKLFSILILTIILPFLLFHLLKSLKKVNSIFLETTQERLLPLFLNSTIIILILWRIFNIEEIPELYFFFMGVLISNITCLVLAFLKFKTDIHMIAYSAVFIFAISLSIHYKINMNNTLALMSIIFGAIATSGLHSKKRPIELIFGLMIGIIPQLWLNVYWL